MSHRKSNQAGFSAVVIVGAVLILGAIAGVGFLVFKKSSAPKSATTNTTSPSPIAQPAPPTPAQEYPNMKLYSNQQYRFSFYYPEEWRVDERDPKTTYLEPVELSLVLVDTTIATTPIVATVAVSSKSLSEVGPVGGADTAQYKQQLTIDGKQAVKYSIPQSKSVNREMYYIAAGSNTYWLATFDEEANIKRIPNYMDKFNKVVDSLRLP
jgi:hypothetical protein